MDITIIYYIIGIFVLYKIYKIFKWLFKNMKPTDVIADFEDSVEINTNNYQRDLSYPKDNNFGENDDDLKK